MFNPLRRHVVGRDPALLGPKAFCGLASPQGNRLLSYLGRRKPLLADVGQEVRQMQETAPCRTLATRFQSIHESMLHLLAVYQMAIAHGEIIPEVIRRLSGLRRQRRRKGDGSRPAHRSGRRSRASATAARLSLFAALARGQSQKRPEIPLRHWSGHLVRPRGIRETGPGDPDRRYTVRADRRHQDRRR